MGIPTTLLSFESSPPTSIGGFPFFKAEQVDYLTERARPCSPFQEGYSLDDLLDVTIALAHSLDVDYDALDVVGLTDAPVELAFEAIAKGKLIYCTSD